VYMYSRSIYLYCTYIYIYGLYNYEDNIYIRINVCSSIYIYILDQFSITQMTKLATQHTVPTTMSGRGIDRIVRGATTCVEKLHRKKEVQMWRRWCRQVVVMVMQRRSATYKDLFILYCIYHTAILSVETLLDWRSTEKQWTGLVYVHVVISVSILYVGSRVRSLPVYIRTGGSYNFASIRHSTANWLCSYKGLELATGPGARRGNGEWCIYIYKMYHWSFQDNISLQVTWNHKFIFYTLHW
jgi:hypothetical protein